MPAATGVLVVHPGAETFAVTRAVSDMRTRKQKSGMSTQHAAAGRVFPVVTQL